jgi:crotonobetainyl-CoA:carnitine CoA-transferase CaiB-like acyl-CoA transferase
MSANTPASLPLSRYKVLDLTIARAGPTAVRLLADWGAAVTRVEPTLSDERDSATGRRRNSDEQNLHRNKRSICVDLKSRDGAAILRRLIEQSDIVVENYRAEVKERLGLSYERLKKINPRIILASISGFGQDGPYCDRPGVDQIVQGMSGLSSVTGEPGGGPMRAGIAISDTTAGMFLGQGILLALLHREHTGEGQWVHTSLIEGMLNKLDFQAARYTVDGEIAAQQGNAHPTFSPMGSFQARDGMVNIAASTDRMFSKFCEALGARELMEHPDYRSMASRHAHRRQLEADIHRVTREYTASELVARLNKVGVPCGPILNIGQAFEDDQVKHLRMTRPARHRALGKLELIRSPINLSRIPHPEQFHHAAPDPGEHTDDLLRELGFEQKAIEAMKAAGTVE